MTVFLTGSTGYVGGFVLRELINAGHRVRCLVRKIPSQSENVNNVSYVEGDVAQADSLANKLKGCDAVVHLVAIIKENKRAGITFEKVNYLGTKNLVHAATEQSVRKFIHMSALGADAADPIPYMRTKGIAQELVRNSGLNFTIFRPSFIYGPGDAVFSMLAKMIRISPFGIIPVFGSGLYRHQPVSVDNVAQGMVRALDCAAAFRKIYDVGGPEPLTYRGQLECIGRVIGKTVHPMPLPMWFSRMLVAGMGLLPFSPINSHQLAMLIRDNTCDPVPFVKDLNIDLVDFRTGLAYLRGI
jgi:uncharacterized protein YbjT (DUF2867 family)